MIFASSENGVAFPPYTELLLANMKLLTLKSLQSSRIFEKPTIFDPI